MGSPCKEGEELGPPRQASRGPISWPVLRDTGDAGGAGSSLDPVAWPPWLQMRTPPPCRFTLLWSCLSQRGHGRSCVQHLPVGLGVRACLLGFLQCGCWSVMTLSVVGLSNYLLNDLSEPGEKSESPHCDR